MNLKQNINFSLWCDFIERDFLQNQFKEILTKEIIHGATSNPAIFEQSITTSDAYTQQISMLQDNSNKKIYEELAITDIKSAALIMKDLHDEQNDSGFISIEVDPSLCDDAQATIDEGVRLFNTIGYNNVMIKVPATPSGYIAMKELTAQGINVNATLIFSVDQAISCAKALNEGINLSPSNPQAVVSIFVSRFDRLLDEKLEKLGLPTAKVGIINATKCYHEIAKFENNNIRTLFASTGVKGNVLSPSYYIDNLIYPNSINTAPLSTIEAYIKNNTFKNSDILSIEECDEFMQKLSQNNININEISDILLKDGLDSFKKSFKIMLEKLKI